MTSVPPSYPTGLASPEDWLDILLPKLPGAVPDMVKQQTFMTIRDFCSLGLAWLDWVVPIEVQATTVQYPLITGFADVEAFLPLTVKHVDEPSSSPSPRYLRPFSAFQASPLIEIGIGEPVEFWSVKPGQLSLRPLPALGSPVVFLDVYSALRPVDLTAVPEWFRSEHAEAIEYGVLSKMYAIPGNNYNLQLAAINQRYYMSRRAQARERARDSYGPTSTRTPFPYFSRGSQRRYSGSPTSR